MFLFWIEISFILFVLWALLAFAYKPIGKIISKLIKDVKDSLEDNTKQ